MENVENVLIIDGAYLQIGVRDINAQSDTNFRLEKENKIKRFLQVLEAILQHTLDKIIFVSAEDYDGMTKNE